MGGSRMVWYGDGMGYQIQHGPTCKRHQTASPGAKAPAQRRTIVSCGQIKYWDSRRMLRQKEGGLPEMGGGRWLLAQMGSEERKEGKSRVQFHHHAAEVWPQYRCTVAPLHLPDLRACSPDPSPKPQNPTPVSPQKCPPFGAAVRRFTGYPVKPARNAECGEVVYFFPPLALLA
jgi:hypothetical protein